MFDIKGLVNSLFRPAAQEGVFDLKSATLFMDELPDSDILQAQIEIVKALQQLNKNPEISMGERFKTIPYLDKKAHSLQSHLLDIYHGKVIEEGISANQVLPTILTFWQEMAAGYLGCIKQLNHKHGRIPEKKLQFFTLRAMELYAIQARYTYMRHMDIDSPVWRNLNRLYQFAEQNDFVKTPQTSENTGEITTIQSIYIQTLMLSLANPDKVQSAQVELIACWLKKWCVAAELETQLQPHQHLFAINIAGAGKPKRIRRDMVGDSWRYWSTEQLVQQINQLHQLLTQGESAVSSGMPAESALPANLDLLQTLANLWSRDVLTPVRKHERQSSNQSIRVITGISHIIALIQQKASGTEPVQTEKWELDDESAGGFGLNCHNDHPVEVGELLALASVGKHAFTVGVVRRVNRNLKGPINIGVETLTHSPVVVELTPLLSGQSFEAIYVPDGPNANPSRFLIIPNAFFSDNREFKFAVQGKNYRIRLSPALEHTAHCVLAKFSVLEKL